MGENTQGGWGGLGGGERKRKRAINEEERQHRYDQRLSASPSAVTGEGRDDERVEGKKVS